MERRAPSVLSTLAVLVLLGLAGGCGAQPELVQRDEAAHTAGEVIWSNSRYLWANVEREAFDVSYAVPTVAADHAVSTRLQAWVQRFDRATRAAVRRSEGAELVAPMPSVRLVVDRVPNAFVLQIPACLVGHAAPDTRPRAVLFSRPHTATATQIPCWQSWPDAPAAALQWLTSLGGLTVTAGAPGRFDITNDGRNPNAPVEASQIAVVAAAPFISVNTGLVTELSEKAMAVTLAHELAHYYRAHGTTSVGDRYDFWYDRPAHIAERPKPIAGGASYGESYRHVKRPRLAIPGQRLHARLGTTLIAWASAMTAPSPDHPCAPLASAAAAWSPGVRAELTTEGSSAMSPDAARAYIALDRAAPQCFEAIVLTDAPAAAGALRLDGLRLPRAWFTERIAPALLEAFPDVDALPRSELEVAGLAALAGRLERRARAIDAAGPPFLARLEANQIGLYTHEQEADDLAMELSAAIGLTPDETISGFLELMYTAERELGAEVFARENAGISARDCEGLYRGGFRVATSEGEREVHVPLGSLFNPHHSSCYRIFNLFREKETHTYAVAPPDPLPVGPTWQSLQVLARELGAR